MTPPTSGPILMSGAMVRAVLREIERPGTGKTQTRRLLKPQPCAGQIAATYRTAEIDWQIKARGGIEVISSHRLKYRPGQLLWVREAWAPLSALTHNDPGVTAIAQRGFFRADQGTVDGEISRWTPSIHMPRWASRLTLEVTGVKVERLKSISREDAIAEGATSRPNCSGFRSLYEGWSMDWSTVGTHSRFASNGPGPLTEHDVSLSDPISAFGAYINALHGGPNWNLKPTTLWGENPWIVAVSFIPHPVNIDQFETRKDASDV